MQSMRTPKAGEDAAEPEKLGTLVTTFAVYRDVLCPRPQSYVSPPMSIGTRRFRDDIRTRSVGGIKPSSQQLDSTSTCQSSCIINLPRV